MIVASICARGGSKGVPDKNLLSLGGRTLMDRTVATASDAPSVDRIICSTDSPEIANLAQRHGVDVPELRPAELSQDSSSKWPVLRYVLELAERLYGERVDLLIDLDLGTPFRLAADIEESIALLREPDVDVVTTGYPAERNPYFNMGERDAEGFVRIVNALPEPITSRHDAPAVFSLTPIVWGMTREFIMHSSHWTEGRLKMVDVPQIRGLDIDTPADLAFAEFLIARGEAE